MIRTRDVLLICFTAFVIALLPIIERSADREMQRQLLLELRRARPSVDVIPEAHKL